MSPTIACVYLMTQRFQKHPFLALFDGPDTNASTEARRAFDRPPSRPSSP